VVVLRFHLSDISNQFVLLKNGLNQWKRPGFISWIGQAPAGGARVSLEACAYLPSFQDHNKNSWYSESFDLKLKNYRFLWHGCSSKSQQLRTTETHESFCDLENCVAYY
jgi:hypothetical protein